MLRPSADELMNHPWILDFRETLRSYEEAEMENPPAEMPPEEEYESASVARQAAIMQEREVEQIIDSPATTSPATSPGHGVDAELVDLPGLENGA
jgi:mitogen-activated protein kinase kinase kinase